MTDEVDLAETRRLVEAEIRRLEALPWSRTVAYFIRRAKALLAELDVAEAVLAPTAQAALDAGVVTFEVVGPSPFAVPARGKEYRAVFSYPPSFLGRPADRYSKTEVTPWTASAAWCGPDACPPAICGGPHRALLTDQGYELVRADQEPIGKPIPHGREGRVGG